MRIPRLYVEAPLQPGQDCELDQQRVHRLTRVFRLRAGAEVVAFDGSGRQFQCELLQHRRDWSLRVQREVPSLPASPVSITLAQSIARNERMDFCLQKAVELGVHAVQPIIAEHCVAPAGRRLENRESHWRRIIEQACEQCGRSDVPELRRPVAIDEWLKNAPGTIVLDVDGTQSLADVKIDRSQVTLLIGPEGGFSDQEKTLMQTLDCRRVCLGPRVLRMETAALAAVTTIQLRAGDLAAL